MQLSVRDVAASRRSYARHFGIGHAVHEEPGLAILAPDGGGLLGLHEGLSPDTPASGRRG